MAKRKRFILNDETLLNSHGFYLLNAGAQLERFNDNPVLLKDHDRSNVFGRWVDLQVDGNKMIAYPEFDMEDEEAVKLAGKVDRRFVVGASIGLHIYEAEMRLDTNGNDAVYVTKWEMLEASIVPIPSNRGAISLQIYDQETGQLIPDDLIKDHVTELSVNVKQNKIMEKVKLTAEAATVLGLQTEAIAPGDVSAAIVKLGKSFTELQASAKQTTTELTELKAKMVELHDKECDAVIGLAVQEGRITEDQREVYLDFAKRDLDKCKGALEKLPAKPTLADAVKQVELSDREKWSYFDWKKKDPSGLSELKANDRNAYDVIVAKKQSK